MAGENTIIIQGSYRGTFALPIDWSDQADPTPYDFMNILSFLIFPGIGQFYYGEVGKGLILGGSHFVGLKMFKVGIFEAEDAFDFGEITALGWVGICIASVSRVWSIIDVPKFEVIWIILERGDRFLSLIYTIHL